MSDRPSFVVEDQSEAIAFLEGRLTPERRIDTHGAVVFLCRRARLQAEARGEVSLHGFLDRGPARRDVRRRDRHQPAARRRRSISASRRSCAAMASWRWARSARASDDAVDWLVVMRRFDEEGLLDRMAARGALTPELMAALGARIAQLPRRLAGRSRRASARPDDYRHSVAADVRQMREAGERLDPPTSEALAEAMPRGARAVRRSGGAPRRGGRDPALPWRPASAQHRAAGRPAGAVRRHRVLRQDRQHRRALRSRLRADGPVRGRGWARSPTGC